MGQMLQVCLDGGCPGPAQTAAVPAIVIRYLLKATLARTPSLYGFHNSNTGGKPNNETVSSQIRPRLMAALACRRTGIGTLAGGSGFCPRGSVPLGECRNRSSNRIHQHHRPRTVARRDCGSRSYVCVRGRRIEARPGWRIFGVGMAIAAVNFLTWLFPGN